MTKSFLCYSIKFCPGFWFPGFPWIFSFLDFSAKIWSWISSMIIFFLDFQNSPTGSPNQKTLDPLNFPFQTVHYHCAFTNIPKIPISSPNYFKFPTSFGNPLECHSSSSPWIRRSKLRHGDPLLGYWTKFGYFGPGFFFFGSTFYCY